MCDILGVPIAKHKTEGPTKCLTFLGIEINTTSMTAKLPKDKLIKYENEIDKIITKTHCTLRELKSLIGMLQFSTCHPCRNMLPQAPPQRYDR